MSDNQGEKANPPYPFGAQKGRAVLLRSPNYWNHSSPHISPQFQTDPPLPSSYHTDETRLRKT